MMTPEIRSLLEALTRLSLRVRMPAHLVGVDDIQGSMQELARKLAGQDYHIPTAVQAIEKWDAPFWPTWHDLERELPSPGWRPGQRRLEAPAVVAARSANEKMPEPFDRMLFISSMRTLHDRSIPCIARESLIRIGNEIAKRRGIAQEAWS